MVVAGFGGSVGFVGGDGGEGEGFVVGVSGENNVLLHFLCSL